MRAAVPLFITGTKYLLSYLYMYTDISIMHHHQRTCVISQKALSLGKWIAPAGQARSQQLVNDPAVPCAAENLTWKHAFSICSGVLGMEPKASCVLGENSFTELHLQPFFFQVTSWVNYFYPLLHNEGTTPLGFSFLIWNKVFQCLLYFPPYLRSPNDISKTWESSDGHSTKASQQSRLWQDRHLTRQWNLGQGKSLHPRDERSSWVPSSSDTTNETQSKIQTFSQIALIQ